MVGTVVAGLSQTAVEAMKAAAADGKLTGEDKIYLKTTALEQAKDLLSDSVVKAASVTVANLESYINQKIEERVLAQKK